MARQKFDILPDISAEDRDLRFRPVENSAPAAPHARADRAL